MNSSTVSNISRCIRQVPVVCCGLLHRKGFQESILSAFRRSSLYTRKPGLKPRDHQVSAQPGKHDFDSHLLLVTGIKQFSCLQVIKALLLQSHQGRGQSRIPVSRTRFYKATTEARPYLRSLRTNVMIVSSQAGIVSLATEYPWRWQLNECG